MRTLAVCVGSCCHVRGSYDVVQELKRLISIHMLEEEFELKARFCFGECRDGVNVELDGEIITGLTRETTGQFFERHILNGKKRV